MKIVKNHNLCFKQLKCNFNAKEISILGVVVEQEEVQIENYKIKAIKEQKTSIKTKEVESFLGFTNFYRCFIKNFSYMAKSLNELKGKKKWKYEEEHQKAFRELKEKITSQPILTLHRREEKSRMETNISGHVIRGFYIGSKKENENQLHFYQE